MPGKIPYLTKRLNLRIPERLYDQLIERACQHQGLLPGAIIPPNLSLYVLTLIRDRLTYITAAEEAKQTTDIDQTAPKAGKGTRHTSKPQVPRMTPKSQKKGDAVK
jgi:hypothetical protein